VTGLYWMCARLLILFGCGLWLTVEAQEEDQVGLLSGGWLWSLWPQSLHTQLVVGILSPAFLRNDCGIGHCYQSWIISGLELASTVFEFLDNLLLDTMCESVMVNVCLRDKLKTGHPLQDTQYLENSLSLFSCFTGPFTCGSQLGFVCWRFLHSHESYVCWLIYVCCFGETPLECHIWYMAVCTLASDWKWGSMWWFSDFNQHAINCEYGLPAFWVDVKSVVVWNKVIFNL